MKSRALNLAMAIVGVVLGLFGSQVLGAQSDADSKPIVREEVQRQSLGTAEGTQAMMLRVQLAPGVSLAEEPTVTYPAEELVYVVEGTATLKRQGEEVQLEAGDGFYNAADEPHTVINESATEPLTVVSVWIGDDEAF